MYFYRSFNPSCHDGLNFIDENTEEAWEKSELCIPKF